MRKNEISADLADQKAENLLAIAKQLGEIMADVDNMGRLRWQAIIDEPGAYETIIIGGAEMQLALKTLAMRLDRSALAKFEG